jgi:hypothetical protein
VAESADDIDALVEGLKALPLIESADLDGDRAAYDAFELVLSAILRAALVPIPPSKREGEGNRFRRFVIEHFPEGRGRFDKSFGDDLWLARCATVKEKRTDDHRQTTPIAFVHKAREAHWTLATSGERILDLDGLIDDFRAAVGELGELLRSSEELCKRARDELALRRVRQVELAATAGLPALSTFSASATGPS